MDTAYYIPTTAICVTLLNRKSTKKFAMKKFPHFQITFLFMGKVYTQFLEELTQLGPHYIKGRRLLTIKL